MPTAAVEPWRGARSCDKLQRMTERLYYSDPRMTDFQAQVVALQPQQSGRVAVVLDRTAFYPTSGGQRFDTGWLETQGRKLRVAEVTEQEDLSVLHWLESMPQDGGPVAVLSPGETVRGTIDVDRRRDHMQQHTGQHMLSAVFLGLLNMPTVSFHMGDESCTIDISAASLNPDQASEVELQVNRLVWEDRPVKIRSSTPGEALALGVRKLPPGLDEVRLIDIQGVDLTACGGTHVASTGEVGAVLLRKLEKVRQGIRVEFVCGERAIRTAARDYQTLRTVADLFSAHLWDAPDHVCKLLEEVRSARKAEEVLKAELADSMAERLVAEAETSGGIRLVCRNQRERDANWIKLLAQRVTRHPNTVALLASAAGAAPGLVFGQAPGGRLDMGALMKQATASLGGRGGGNRDMAQGGAPAGADVQPALDAVAAQVREQLASAAPDS
jgi:alanyl-tRNA synthetase